MARIAIADDSRPIRLLLRRRLEAAGHEVIEATDGAELIEVIETDYDGRVDLALVDWMMPRLDGAGTAAAITDRWPDMPVVGFTAGWSAGDEGFPEYTDDFVGKPFDFDYLFAKIDELTGELPRP